MSHRPQPEPAAQPCHLPPYTEHVVGESPISVGVTVVGVASVSGARLELRQYTGTRSFETHAVDEFAHPAAFARFIQHELHPAVELMAVRTWRRVGALRRGAGAELLVDAEPFVATDMPGEPS